MADLGELLGRTLVLVAHADDEAVACGALLQRMREPAVVICTDGAPRDEYFWGVYGTRAAYARLRAKEARRALDAVGVQDLVLLPALSPDDIFVDQELFRQIPQAMDDLMEITWRLRPEAILTLAYEGGHPDHDACNFLGRQLADSLDVAIWEAPLYQRATSDKLIVQRFLTETGQELSLEITAGELARKRTMQAAYASQRNVLATFDSSLEIVRPMRQYDYSQPPHEGRLNYEAWGWPTRGWELCDQFTQYLNGEHGSASFAARRRVA